MSKLIGSITRTIFKSDNNYTVLLFKVKENDINEKYNGKTVTVTGYFYDIDENFDLSLIGEFLKHSKYGEQFNVSSYTKVIPDDKNSIVTFLSSDLFKGIGTSKALKIYETLGDDCINIIKEDASCLKDVPTLSDKNIEVIVNRLNELDQSTDTIILLTELGFNIKDATSIYKYYKERTIEIVNNDIYKIYYDVLNISFNKVDSIARKNGILRDDKRRIEAGIIYSMNLLTIERGDTYSLIDEVYKTLRIVINYEPDYEFFKESLSNLVSNLKIVEMNDSYQLVEYYEADNNIVKRLTYLNNKEDIVYKKDLLDKKISKFESENKIIYDETQKEAIRNAFLKNFLIITGGPGTGKTTIINSIVSLYMDIFNLKYNELDDEIVLLAPTGRASKRLMETTNYKASTIHRFLKWNKDTNKFQVNEYNKSHAKLVIIDEVSMIDTMLLNSLLNGLRYDTRIIMVGDYNQLPSVGAGEVLKDLIDSDIFNVISLSRLYRQEKDSNIISLAYDVNLGSVNYSLFNKNQDLYFYQSDSNDIKNNLIKIVEKYKDYDYHDFQIMAPMYKTMNGINNLNKVMQEIFNPKSSDKNEIMIYDTVYRVGDKVLQLINMPDDNIYNGDIGIILEIDNIKKEITIDYDSNIVTLTSSNFSNITLGYVISIHKSQGSEFKTVVIPVLKEYGRMLYRKLIYTGITRSREELILIGEKIAFDYSVKNNNLDYRKTNLCEKIKKRYL